MLGIFGYADGGFVNGGTTMSDLLWNSPMRTLDPGTMGGDSAPFGFLLGMLAVTLLCYSDVLETSAPIRRRSSRSCTCVTWKNAPDWTDLFDQDGSEIRIMA